MYGHESCDASPARIAKLMAEPGAYTPPTLFHLDGGGFLARAASAGLSTKESGILTLARRTECAPRNILFGKPTLKLVHCFRLCVSV